MWTNRPLQLMGRAHALSAWRRPASLRHPHVYASRGKRLIPGPGAGAGGQGCSLLSKGLKGCAGERLGELGCGGQGLSCLRGPEVQRTERHSPGRVTEKSVDGGEERERQKHTQARTDRRRAVDAHILRCREEWGEAAEGLSCQERLRQEEGQTGWWAQIGNGPEERHFTGSCRDTDGEPRTQTGSRVAEHEPAVGQIQFQDVLLLLPVPTFIFL